MSVKTTDEVSEAVNGAFRTEKDSLGDVQVPVDAWYGAQTVRAIRNFPITGLKPHPTLVRATVLVKRAAAEVNRDLGQLDPERANAIIAVAEQVLGGGRAAGGGRLGQHLAVPPQAGGCGVSRGIEREQQQKRSTDPNRRRTA